MAGTEDRCVSPQFQLQQRVLSSRCTLQPAARLVALAIAARFDRRGWCYMSYRDLAERTGLSRATIKRVVTLLCTGDEPPIERSKMGRVYQFRLVSTLSSLGDNRAHGEPGCDPDDDPDRAHGEPGHPRRGAPDRGHGEPGSTSTGLMVSPQQKSIGVMVSHKLKKENTEEDSSPTVVVVTNHPVENCGKLESPIDGPGTANSTDERTGAETNWYTARTVPTPTRHEPDAPNRQATRAALREIREALHRTRLGTRQMRLAVGAAAGSRGGAA